MLGTRVEVDGRGDGRHLGARLRAFTGVGPLGFTDTMEIVEWEPPRRCVVRHTGKVVRGDGVFEVVPLGPAGPGSSGRSCWTCRWARSGRWACGWSSRCSGSGSRTRCARWRGGRAVGELCALRLGHLGARVRRLPRRRVGPPAARRRPRCSSGCRWRASSRGCPGWSSCASGPRSAPRSPGSTRRRSPGSTTPTSRGCSPTRASSATALKIEATVANARAVLELDTPLDELLWSFAPADAPAAGHAGRGPGREPGVHGDGQGAEAARAALRRADHVLRAHAGRGHRRRPCADLLARCH